MSNIITPDTDKLERLIDQLVNDVKELVGRIDKVELEIEKMGNRLDQICPKVNHIDQTISWLAERSLRS